MRKRGFSFYYKCILATLRINTLKQVYASPIVFSFINVPTFNNNNNNNKFLYDTEIVLL